MALLTSPSSHRPDSHSRQRFGLQSPGLPLDRRSMLHRIQSTTQLAQTRKGVR